LIQTIGRAARNLNGKAILYGDRITNSMEKAIGETQRRREKQIAHNLAHGITPRGVVKRIKDIIDGVYNAEEAVAARLEEKKHRIVAEMDPKQLAKELKRLEKEMLNAAQNLEFEKAANLRDELKRLRERAFGHD
jgi:excinuclease ABC subunit B